MDLINLFGIVLDCSGSMIQHIKPLVNGLNIFLEEHSGKNNLLSCLTFNVKSSFVYEFQALDEIPKFHPSSFVLKDTTALRDAINTMIHHCEARQNKTVMPIIIVVTDGYDNSSNISNTELASIVEQKKNKGWKFIFLGTNQDAPEMGKSMGIDPKMSITFDENDGQIHAWKATSKMCKSMSTSTHISFSDDERYMAKSKFMTIHSKKLTANNAYLGSDENDTIRLKKKCTIC